MFVVGTCSTAAFNIFYDIVYCATCRKGPPFVLIFLANLVQHYQSPALGAYCQIVSSYRSNLPRLLISGFKMFLSL
jgi:hypothetical protein